MYGRVRQKYCRAPIVQGLISEGLTNKCRKIICGCHRGIDGLGFKNVGTFENVNNVSFCDKWSLDYVRMDLMPRKNIIKRLRFLTTKSVFEVVRRSSIEACLKLVMIISST